MDIADGLAGYFIRRSKFETAYMDVIDVLGIMGGSSRETASTVAALTMAAVFPAVNGNAWDVY